MSFWQKLYNEGRKGVDWVAQQLYNIGETAFQKDSRASGMKTPPIRDYGKVGEAVDDFIRKWSGQESYYEEQAREENDRYWADYYKNTGIDPKDVKYPIRAGVNMNNAGQQIPMMAIGTGKRAITELYGGQK